MAISLSGKAKPLNVFTLTMINVIAVASLRTLPFSAKFGASLVSYYLGIALLIFFPVALISAELATTWPKRGGIYLWVKEAFGYKLGFLVIWLQWVYNIVWYPTILATIGTILMYLIVPDGQYHPIIIVLISLAVFWISTIANFYGMQVSSWISTICSVLGTIVPMAVIIGLGMWWLSPTQNVAQIDLSLNSLLPQATSISDLALVTTIIFGLMGLEMSAVHVADVQNPKRDYPLALRNSSILILAILLFASLTVAMVVPTEELNIVTGVVQAFSYFFIVLDMPYLLPWIVAAIIIGAVGGIAAWIIGPTKGLLVAAQEENLPSFFTKTNKKGVPVAILALQGIIVSILSLSYVLLPTIETAYFILSQLTAILALLMYVLMFLAAIALRYKYPKISRPYRIPFGKVGLWIVGGVGAVSSLFAMFLGFVPPSQIVTGELLTYELLLVGGVLVFCVPAFFIHKKSRVLDRVLTVFRRKR